MRKILCLLSLFCLINCHTRATSSQVPEGKIDTVRYYKEWAGHPIGQLEKVYDHLKSKKDCASFVFLAGDSSLDNKNWLFESLDKNNREHYKRENSKTFAEAVPVYQDILSPSLMVKDLNYWFSFYLNERPVGEEKVCAINTAVEATTLMNGTDIRDKAQDRFIREKITDEDYLVISVGGNDVAFRSLQDTQIKLRSLMAALQQARVSLGADSPEASPFIILFKDKIEEYIKKLVGDKVPKKIVVAMIYYPDENYTSSWASGTLTELNYRNTPGPTQALIKFLFDNATSQVRVDGLTIEGIALYKKLDGKTTNHYKQAVEPSVEGGDVLAQYYLESLGLRD